MNEWKEIAFSEIIELIGGGTPRTSVSEYWEGNIPWLSVADFNTGRKYVFDTEKKITELGLLNSSTNLLKKGDIIISARGTVGVVAVLGKEMTFNQSCYGIRAQTNKSTNEYVYYLLKNTISNFTQIAHGGVFDTITRDSFKEIEILLPPLPEQKSIASILSSLDDKIDLLHRQNATLEAMAETLFRQWFVEEAKEEWEDTTLDKHTEAFRGLSYKGSGLADYGVGLPMHNLNSVYEGGGYKYEGVKYYTGDYKERHLISPGDIIVTNTEQGHDLRLIGFPAIVPDTFGNKGLFSQHIYRLLPIKNSYLSTEFIYYLLMTPVVREQVTAATNGSTVNMLAIDGLQRPKFKLPPKETVIEFTAIAANYRKKKNINHKQIQTLTKLRDTLLPKLMSAEVRVKV
ncbi:restriction endonuclease subunit S [Agriterribacter sp.]|uniref:restriction endonuclease subunit S n=1 Tax=Agriterribacter sp. TaxID=2821509 RepID=UPI002C4C9E8B|nr:restriction endonuclease subunit S [Agriterribacter sp.]HRO45340.1 restriction endonuclease subunit S [Agriterribacter sp.]HRQ17099.1 restriction endonuclease subunit S [Agriterribacter sp.]